MDKRWHSIAIDILCYRGAECDTNHYLGVAEVRRDWQ